jgi:hypothetical protein
LSEDEVTVLDSGPSGSGGGADGGGFGGSIPFAFKFASTSLTLRVSAST